MNGCPDGARHGLSNDTLKRIQQALAQYPQIDQAVLYGSRAKGTFKPGSDIDLTLRGPMLNFSLLGDIEQSLDDLLLPYEIDLSLYEHLNHAELKAHIDRVGQVIYQRHP